MIIKLKNLSALVEINSLGAELKSFKDVFGLEYIWNSDPKYWHRSSPVLFPTIGMLKDDVALISDTKYNLPRHGFSRDKEFKLLYNSDDKAIFNLSYDYETLKTYPYKFNLQLTYTLKENSLCISYDVFNIGHDEMYYGLGAHPAFNCPLLEGEKFEDYILKFNKDEPDGAAVYDTKNNYLNLLDRNHILDQDNKIKLDYSLFKSDAIIFNNLKSNIISLYHITSGRGVELSIEGFENLGIWTPYPNKSPFICIEPWSSLPYCKGETQDFTKKTGIKKLSASEKHSYSINITTV